MHELLAGTGRCDITPAPGTPQGWVGGRSDQGGIGADIPLFATALVLQDPRQSVAIIDVDSIGFDPEWTLRILNAVAGMTGLPRENIRLSCTHTHSGPNTFRLAVITEGRDMIMEYLHALPLKIGGGVGEGAPRDPPVC